MSKVDIVIVRNSFSGFPLLEGQIMDVHLICSGAVQKESASSSTVFMHNHREKIISNTLRWLLIASLPKGKKTKAWACPINCHCLLQLLSSFLSVMLASLKWINTGSYSGLTGKLPFQLAS